jgi:hypothetical protein
MTQDKQSPGYGKLIGDMYARWVLDCVVEMAYAVSVDFVARPDFYKGSDVPEGIAELRSAYGYARDYPNKSQRQDLNSPVFGLSDGYAPDSGTDKFRALRRPLFDACIAYSERSVDVAAQKLKQRVLSALDPFPPYLRNFDGESIKLTYKQVKSLSDLSYKVLTSKSVAHVFGVDQPPDATWPLDANDPKGSQLVRSIGERLQPKDAVFNEEKFGRLRRMAQEGRDALEAILTNTTTDQSFENLVTRVYTWAISIKDYWTPVVAPTK